MKLSPPIIIAMIASVAIHATLVAPSTSTEIALPSSKGSAIAVKIEEIKHVVAKPTTLPPALKKTNNQPKPIIKKIVKSKQSTNIVKQETAKESEAETHKALAQVKSDLIKKLNHNFVYPKLAQRKNWQGKVILTLHVSPSGKIENIYLATSSGYNVLDNAAIASLYKVGKLHNISTWFSNGINLNLPVIYKLTES